MFYAQGNGHEGGRRKVLVLGEKREEVGRREEQKERMRESQESTGKRYRIN